LTTERDLDHEVTLSPLASLSGAERYHGLDKSGPRESQDALLGKLPTKGTSRLNVSAG
jgi:hypothetical protein